jgi:hypothetical protein
MLELQGMFPAVPHIGVTGGVRINRGFSISCEIRVSVDFIGRWGYKWIDLFVISPFKTSTPSSGGYTSGT